MDMVFPIVLFFLAVIIHEVAHGWVAYKLGDNTAKYLGRLTLNPLKHIDPFGTIILPALLLLSKSPFLFGWAKPVPVNFFAFKNTRKGMFLVGLAGPISNIILAVLVSWVIKLQIVFLPLEILQYFMVLNMVLAVFNLIPIPPLDGSRIVLAFLPAKAAYYYMKLEVFGFAILFFMLYLGLMREIVWPIVLILIRFLGV